MILGRTPEGLIKIKKDAPLGLRAVNCACCGCGCGITIPQALREIVANATINTITMFGIAPDHFVPVGTPYPFWLAFFSSMNPYLRAEIIYVPETGCLSISGFYTEYNGAGYQPLPIPPGGLIAGYQAFGDGQFCEDQQENPTQNGTFTINGEGAYNYYYFTGIDPNSGLEYPAVPPPNFVFT